MVLLVEPSPKSQKRLVMVPVEVSVNVTDNCHAPLVGLAVKADAGTCAPIPVAELVRFGPLLVRKVTRLLNVPVLVGLNFINTLVEPWGGKVKLVADTILNGRAPTVIATFVTTMLPAFVATKLPCALLPSRSVPKSRFCGETAS